MIGIDLRLCGNCFSLNVGTSILRCEIILVLILSDFFVDLSIMDAKPKSLALAFLISLTHSKLDFPVVITSSIIKTFAPFLILNPLLNLNFPSVSYTHLTLPTKRIV